MTDLKPRRGLGSIRCHDVEPGQADPDDENEKRRSHEERSVVIPVQVLFFGSRTVSG